MYKVPEALLASLERVAGFDRASFVAVHESPNSVTSVRLNPAKITDVPGQLGIKSAVPWSQYGFYLTERPSFTFDPLFHAGTYYVQEASSMFLEKAFRQTVDCSQHLVVLDLCAAPGGKSTHLQSLLQKDDVLVSNEVIKTRVTILAENLTKWGAVNTIVTNNDPADFGKIESLFDVIVVDAPCSGSGLFKKDNEAITEWSEANVEHCSVRQQRILADVWPALKPGGVLIYSTCSYSVQEDEYIIDFIAQQGAEGMALSLQNEWNIVPTYFSENNCAGYRFYPNRVDGEGFFIACLRKTSSDIAEYDARQQAYKADKKLEAIAAKWVSKKADMHLYRREDQLFMMPPNTLQLFLQLQKRLNIRKAGCKIGDLVRDELVPDHALAVSGLVNDALPQFELSYEEAIAFLRRADFILENAPKGWLLVCYKSHPLGWIKNLGNRINNYYPKEWRIRN